MGVNITYMGTKKNLAPSVAEVINCAKPGILLDAFAGMCSVGELVAPERQVWGNDVQLFASETARALFASRDEPPDAIRVADLHFDCFERHRTLLSAPRHRWISLETDFLNAVTFRGFTRISSALSKALVDNVPSRTRNYDLFTTTYPDTYFGIQQCIEADSIACAIDDAAARHLLTCDQQRWLLIALGRALLKVANAPGHFAQFLKPKRHSFKRYVALRNRRLWDEWLFSIGELQSAGTLQWRQRNRVFRADSLALLPQLHSEGVRPSVVYADPPYTDDQYSRFYHVLDTLMLYDYPSVTGAGLYRGNRFTTPFSLRSTVKNAFESLVSSTAKLGADLVLSYPSNGLLHETGAEPVNILRKHYRRVECCRSIPHLHSTFGASKGPSQSNATEMIYLAR